MADIEFNEQSWRKTFSSEAAAWADGKLLGLATVGNVAVTSRFRGQLVKFDSVADPAAFEAHLRKRGYEKQAYL